MIAFASPPPVNFPLGSCLATSAVAQTFSPDQLKGILGRHANGDWGELGPGDKQLNDQAVAQRDGRLLSTYTIPGHDRLYVITEDLALGVETVTTVLFVDEYRSKGQGLGWWPEIKEKNAW